jgi:hypothetical protein
MAITLSAMLCTGGAGVIGNRGLTTGFCHSLKWVSLSALPSEIKALTKLSGIVFALPAAARRSVGETGYGPQGHIYAQTQGHAPWSRQIRDAIASI